MTENIAFFPECSPCRIDQIEIGDRVIEDCQVFLVENIARKDIGKRRLILRMTDKNERTWYAEYARDEIVQKAGLIAVEDA